MLLPSLLSLIHSSVRFEEPETGGSGGTPPADENDKPVTMTQAELNAKFAAEAAKGKRSGRKEFEQELATRLGVTIEQAEGIIKAQKDREDAEKSDAQKAKEAAEAEKAEAAKERAEAARERHFAKVERKLIKAGVDPDRAEDLKDLVKAEVGADDDAITEAIDKVKEKFPTLFEVATDNGRPKPVGGNPAGGGPAPKKPAKDNAFERGKERAMSLPGAKKAS